MAAVPPESLRNVAICGHSTCGKTSLVENLLLVGGAIQRQGDIGEGTTVGDFDDQEKERQHSIDLACAYLNHGGVEVNLLDTPGYRDFIGQVYCAMEAVECVVIVVDADDGVRPNTRKIWELAEQYNLPCVVVINRCDREHAKGDEIVAQIQAQLSDRAVPLTYPNAVGAAFESVELTLGNDSASVKAKEFGEALMEAVVESNDELMERYLGGEAVSPDELRTQLRLAMASRSVFPVFFTSAKKDVGVTELLDSLVAYAPAASESVGRKLREPAGDAGDDGEESETHDAPLTADGPFCAVVFKVVADPYVGKLTYLRVLSGELPHNGSFINPRTGKHEKVGKMIRLQGKEQEAVETATAGTILCLVKLEGLETFDMVMTDKPLTWVSGQLPTPMFSRAVVPKSTADEKKFAEAIHKIVDEDVMIRSDRDARTGEFVVSGTSQLHLQILWDRLKSRYGVEVETKEPKTPYLETISAKAEDHYRHKKQSGGSGEFAEVWLRVEPRERGEGVEFKRSVFGGAISDSYIGSAEKGIRSCLEQGVIAGCPVVDVRVDIFDGKEHPVDSKDIAFQKAGREAFKLALSKAKPVLLEPVVDLEVTFPSENMGDIQGDLNRRRGRVIGVDAHGDFQTLKGQVPLAELADYASSLGSVTGGQGTYSIERSHYEAVPANVQQKVSQAAKADAAKDGDGHH
jgi:elongation factor G